MADERTVYGIKLQNYLAPITADELTVIFNGTTYKVPKAVDGSYMCYGTLGLRTNSAVPSDCPFCIESYVGGDNIVYVNDDTYFNHNPFTIKIIEDSVTTTTECFKKAVQSAASPLIVEATLAPYEATTQSPSYLHASTEEIMEAMTTRGVVVRDPYGNLYSVLSATNVSVTIAMGVYNSTTQQTDLLTFCYTNSGQGLEYPKTGLQ